MTLPRWLAIARYQKHSPPLHVLVKGFVGYTPGGAADSPASGLDENGQSLFDVIPRA